MEKEQIAFFDAKPYDKEWFDKYNTDYEIIYYDGRLRPQNAKLAEGCKAVCAFVNDEINEKTIDILSRLEVEVILLRCAGYNNVSVEEAKKRGIKVLRVPDYSPYAVAEHTMGLILALNRKIPRAYIRTRDFNFSLNGLTGFDLHGKTAGVIGTGKIGRVFIDICKGFGMEIIAFDPKPADIDGVRYVSKEELFKRSDIISLHCPLTKETNYMINDEALRLMKKNALIVNTSRGRLIDTEALLIALNEKRIGGAALDVYEEESGLFFEDNSDRIVTDEVISLLVSRPNVIITSHQAFLTEEALSNIAQITLKNFDDFLAGNSLENEVK
ncbi:MAG: 2-hydroxyacid dehydrogenase [Oscillospiraceae bacterium]|nr:2-hydroxyacid dehydrogenase [Oscillospiraceae bacterium]